jgi:hypothetical protein
MFRTTITALSSLEQVAAGRKRFLSPAYLSHVARYEASLATSQLRFRRRLARIVRDGRPIVAGPWCSEIGFELLYWIPFLRSALERGAVDPARVTVVSRGGAEPWYRDVGVHYVELLDLFREDELKEWLTRRVESSRTQKQMAVGPFEREFRSRAGDALPDDFALLHPSLMYELFTPFWAGRRSVELVSSWTRWGPLPPARGRRTEELPSWLPDDYVAVKAYFTKPFPDTAANRDFVARLLSSLARGTNVVLLSSGVDIDDHSEYAVRDGAVQTISAHMTPPDNLAVQTDVIAGARALVTTYGGFSYLGPLLGTPTVSFLSTDNFKPTHLQVLELMLRGLRRQGEPASFVHAHVDDFPLLELVSSSIRGRAVLP